MIKSIRANGKASYDDFDLYIASRLISIPASKEILESVPFQNGSYDFSRINGEIAYEAREISYVFDVAEFTIEEMENNKRKILQWLSSIYNTDIYDDYIKDYHFHGTFITPEWTEEASQGALTVKFRVYPYMIANVSTKYEVDLTENETKTIEITNNSAHSVSTIITCTNNLLVIKDGLQYSVPSGTTKTNDFSLSPGENNIQLKGKGKAKIEFYEEVL